jgi:hypothetical protein
MEQGSGNMTAQLTDKSAADIAFGEIRSGSHISGYSRELALTKLEGLIESGAWRLCGAGYSGINVFLGNVWERDETFRLVADRRRKLAIRIKELEGEASNRAIGGALGADERTIRRDLAAANAAGDEIDSNEFSVWSSEDAAFAAAFVPNFKALLWDADPVNTVDGLFADIRRDFSRHPEGTYARARAFAEALIMTGRAYGFMKAHPEVLEAVIAATDWDEDWLTICADAESLLVAELPDDAIARMIWLGSRA